jgi:hypothetical protein
MFTSSANHENFLQSAVLSVEKSFGIKLSVEKMTQIIGNKMDSECKSYAYREVSPYMDTSPLEQIADIISNHYLGRPWPSYGEDIDMEKYFYTLLDAKIAADV